MRACLAGFTLRALRSDLSGLALRTLWTHRALVTLGSRGTLGPDLPGFPFEAPEASRTDLPGVALGSLGAGLTRFALGTWLALYAGVTLGTGIASDALGALSASLTLQPDLAGYPRGTWFALRALRPDLAGFALGTWFAGRSPPTWRPDRPDRTRIALWACLARIALRSDGTGFARGPCLPGSARGTLRARWARLAGCALGTWRALWPGRSWLAWCTALAGLTLRSCRAELDRRGVGGTRRCGRLADRNALEHALWGEAA